jgi:hypothetical protein
MTTDARIALVGKTFRFPEGRKAFKVFGLSSLPGRIEIFEGRTRRFVDAEIILRCLATGVIEEVA